LDVGADEGVLEMAKSNQRRVTLQRNCLTSVSRTI
jgi:hypothetical protein